MGPNAWQFGVLVLATGLFLYFLPSSIAWARDHHNLASITALNLFLGWTLIGWVAALVWAVAAVKPDGQAMAAPIEDRIRCPECAELILRSAKVCKHCGYRTEVAIRPELIQSDEALPLIHLDQQRSSR